jgi:hypothetical protein
MRITRTHYVYLGKDSRIRGYISRIHVCFRIQKVSASERVWETLKLNYNEGLSPYLSVNTSSRFKNRSLIAVQGIIYLCSEIHAKYGKRSVWEERKILGSGTWWCILIIKPTRCTNFSNLSWNRTLHVPDSFSAHHQEPSSPPNVEPDGAYSSHWVLKGLICWYDWWAASNTQDRCPVASGWVVHVGNVLQNVPFSLNVHGSDGSPLQLFIAHTHRSPRAKSGYTWTPVN